MSDAGRVGNAEAAESKVKSSPALGSVSSPSGAATATNEGAVLGAIVVTAIRRCRRGEAGRDEGTRLGGGGVAVAEISGDSDTGCGAGAATGCAIAYGAATVWAPALLVSESLTPADASNARRRRSSSAARRASVVEAEFCCSAWSRRARACLSALAAAPLSARPIALKSGATKLITITAITMSEMRSIAPSSTTGCA